MEFATTETNKKDSLTVTARISIALPKRKPMNGKTVWLSINKKNTILLARLQQKEIKCFVCGDACVQGYC